MIREIEMFRILYIVDMKYRCVRRGKVGDPGHSAAKPAVLELAQGQEYVPSMVVLWTLNYVSDVLIKLNCALER